MSCYCTVSCQYWTEFWNQGPFQRNWPIGVFLGTRIRIVDIKLDKTNVNPTNPYNGIGMLIGWHFKRTGTQGPLLLAWINSYPITDNYIHYKVWDEITYILPNFNGATTEVGVWISNFIPHFTWHVVIYLRLDFSLSMLVKRPLWFLFWLKFPYDRINNDPAMVQITIIDKWLSEPMVAWITDAYMSNPVLMS